MGMRTKMSATSFFSFCESHHYLFGLALATSSTVALYSTYQLWKESSESSTSKEENSSEEESFWDKEECFITWVKYHFASKEDLLTLESYDFGALPDGFLLSNTLANEAIAAFKDVKEGVPRRALDVGCAAGGISFELAREFQQVVGLDFSKAAVTIANRLKKKGIHEYPNVIEGEIKKNQLARVHPSIDRDRVTFMQGDACDMPANIGQFGCVVAGNVICQVPNPYKFLEQLPKIVPSGGIVFLVENYSWFEMFTAKEFWLGGFRDANGKPVMGIDTLIKEMDRLGFELIKVKEYPFFEREDSNRNFHTGVNQGTMWKKK